MDLGKIISALSDSELELFYNYKHELHTTGVAHKSDELNALYSKLKSLTHPEIPNETFDLIFYSEICKRYFNKK